MNVAVSPVPQSRTHVQRLAPPVRRIDDIHVNPLGVFGEFAPEGRVWSKIVQMVAPCGAVRCNVHKVIPWDWG